MPRTQAMSRLLTFLAVLLAALMTGCAALPSLEGRTVSTKIADTAGTRLGKAVDNAARSHPNESGLLRLANGHDAFAARVRLADIAERSLDVQYYIWDNDLTGTLLLDSLRRAADRGVRVRMLLDDSGTHDFDAVLASLIEHPNIEVRLFNPFAMRHFRNLAYLTDFSRLNRRMHNKSFTADNHVTIVGGRNVGDEYFSAGADLTFLDLDVVAIGPVVDAVSDDFDRYWASDSAYPADRLVAAATPEARAEVRAAAVRIEQSPEAAAYVEAVEQQPLVKKMLDNDLTFDWAVAHFVSDDPAKGLDRAPADELMWPRLKRVMKPPTTELDIVSAYFVPGRDGVDYLTSLARQGTQVRVVTNSLESTDVAAADAGYAKWRRPLLEAGVVLWEVKRETIEGTQAGRATRGSGLTGSGGSRRGGGSGRPGGSGSSLHAKTFESDRSQVFIGSFNIDQRSLNLNTELGLVIDSPSMASSVADVIETGLDDRAYRVELGPDGALRWIDNVRGRRVVHDTEPGTTFWERFGVRLLSLLPIDWLL